MKGLVRDPSRPSGVAVADLPDPGRLGPQEVLVRMRLTPINPADRLVIGGHYAPLDGLPQVVGAEGMGVVEAIGTEVASVAPGQRVILLSRGNWVEWRCVQATQLLVVPDALPDMQAAILRINPATAMGLLDRLGLTRGDWLIQNGAGSSVAGWVRRLAARKGLRMLNIVRGEGLGEVPDAVVMDGDDLAARVAVVTGGREPLGALDAVAGAATGRLAQCLAPNGTLLVYGHLSGEPCTIPSTFLTTKSLNLHGFTLRSFEADESVAQRVARYAELASLAIEDPEPIASVFALDQIDVALAPERGRPRGRILLAP